MLQTVLLKIVLQVEKKILFQNNVRGLKKLKSNLRPRTDLFDFKLHETRLVANQI
ncbi:hypothetical protein STA3757_02830 [Stanieria sp. NIES-3757]|nr:hypothetical protein STA3757_02830 [Stanieria sp. NIES-3757]